MRTLIVRTADAVVSGQREVCSPYALMPRLRAALERRADGEVVTTLSLSPGSETGSLPWEALAGYVAARQGDATVTHAMDVVAGAAALVARRLTGVPVVVRAQLVGAPADPTGRRSSLRAAVLRAADAVLAPTVADRELVRRAGVAAERVVVCPDAALIAHAEATEPGPRANAARRPDRYLLGVSGVPRQRSTQEGLLRTLARDHDLHLVLVGPPAPSEATRCFLTRAQELSVTDQVDIGPAVPATELVPLVDGANVVLATRCDPTSGLAALLAMGRARPVIGLRSGGTEDVVVDGVTGRLVDPGRAHDLATAVASTVTDPFRRVSWGQAGLDRLLTRYDAGSVLDGVTTAYLRAAG